LALGSTVAAYTAYTQPRITDRDDSVVVVAGSNERLTAVDWHDDTGEVTLLREADGVTVRTVAPGKPPPGDRPQVYPGTPLAKELLAKMAPLKAPRSLGQLTDEQLKSFGLDQPKQSLVLHFGDEAKTVQVGNPVFGSGDYYAKGPDGGAYLLRATTFTAMMHGALGLQDRDLVGVPRAKIDRLVITSGAGRRELVQRHGEEPGQGFFADPSDPKRKLEVSSAWVDRLLRLRVTELTDEAPQGEPKLTVEIFEGPRSAARVRFWSGDLADTAVTERFKSPVHLHKSATEGVVKDVENVFNDGKAAEARASEPQSP
jgi:hypothetical protein